MNPLPLPESNASSPTSSVSRPSSASSMSRQTSSAAHRAEPRESTRAKVGMLQLASELGNVSKACKIMGYSRDSFYRFKKLYEAGGEEALVEISRRKPILKNRVAPEVESAVLKLALQQPSWGQARVARELASFGLTVSAAGVRCIWLRHELQTARLRQKARSERFAPESDTGADGAAQDARSPLRAYSGLSSREGARSAAGA